MKQNLIILIAIIMLVVAHVSTRRVHRRAHSHRTKTRDPKSNPFYQFLVGFLAELGGTPDFVDLCSKQVPGWEAVGTTEGKDNKTNEAVSGSKSTWEKILGYLGAGIDLVCTLKEQITSFLTKSRRRYVRLLAQGKIRRRRFKWSVGGLWNSVTGVVADVSETIIKGTSRVGSSLVDGIKWVEKKGTDAIHYIKDKMTTIFKPVYDLFESIKDSITNYLTKHPFLLKLLEFGRCFLKAKGIQAIKTMITSITAMITLIPKLSTPAGWIELVVNLVCGWKDLKEGIQNLTKALDEADILKRYNFYGRFIAKIWTAAVS